jgi:hypothetical protein
VTHAPAALAGGRILLTPSAGADGSVQWACHAEGIAADALPPTCR